MSDKEFDNGSITAAVCLCPAFDLENSMDFIEQSVYGFYGWNFVSSFKESLKKQKSRCNVKDEFNKNKYSKFSFDHVWDEVSSL